MSETNKKLLQFAIIFIISAVILFYIMQTEKPSDFIHPPPAVDSLAVSLREEISYLQDSLRQDSANIEIIIRIANGYFDLDQYQSAIEYYEKALEIQPDRPLVLTDCAIMYYHLGKNDTALEYLNKAINLKSDLAQAYFNKGLILMTADNNPKAALAVWREYIDIAPESEYAKMMIKRIEAIESGSK
ncbi:MAG: tetratricopeptide repeat protein [candidate division Zixibacteria bacterium]|nr:tetratricopeptide repeat protein [candidate division Zixibacteria bacterium]